MKRDDSAWPITAWTLTAPESYVLQHGPKASGKETFKVAVLELVSRGTLRLVEVEERDAGGRVTRMSVLAPPLKPKRRGKRTSAPAPRPAPGPPEAGPLYAVWLLYLGMPRAIVVDGAKGVPVADFARAAVRRYGSLDEFRTDEVVASLVDRGLFAREQYRKLGLFSAQRVVVTPAGKQARADLERRLALGREQFGGWVDHDPARALAFVGLAGASVLLMNPLYPEFQRLRQQLGSGPTMTVDQVSTGATFFGSNPGGVRPPPEEAPIDPTPIDPTVGGLNIGGLDLSGLDLSGLSLEGIDLGNLSFDVDLSAFDSLGGAFDAIDAGIDSGGSGDSGSGDSGGGDGGGGDSGGGGGGSGE